VEAVALDFLDYANDIANNRQDRFCFKTACFIKRNWHSFNHKIVHKVAHTLHHIWEELVKVGIGFKLLSADFKFFVLSQKSKIDYKYDKPSLKKDIKLK
jgi:hypothetical protein